ncbi:putative RNA polymerase II nuclear localization protein SLC7A6OS [Rhinophrynus dorsalis]
MEAAVLRVKRKRGADPAEALILSCKRLRIEEETAEADTVTKQVFKLAVTVRSQNEPLQKYVQEAISRDRASLILQPSSGSAQRIQQDLRAWKETKRQDSRYRLISSLRPKYQGEDDISLDTSQATSPDITHLPSVPVEAPEQERAHAQNGISGKFQLFDMVQEEPEEDAEDYKKDKEPETILCNSVRMIRERLIVSETGQGAEHRESTEDYVYDIYYSETSPHCWIQDILSVQPYTQEQELVADDIEPEEIYEDEDDENEENNWRNEYPEEEEEEEEDSDKEERYLGYYEAGEEEETRGQAWHRYRQRALLEFGYDDIEEADSD